MVILTLCILSLTKNIVLSLTSFEFFLQLRFGKSSYPWIKNEMLSITLLLKFSLLIFYFRQVEEHVYAIHLNSFHDPDAQLQCYGSGM